MRKQLFFIYDDNCKSDNKIILRDDYKLEVFKPSIFRLNNHYQNHLIYIFWYIFTIGKYRIVYVKNSKGDIIHYSHLLPKIIKFPFMNKNDLEIGPCWTKEEYRGQGIYPYVLSYIIREYRQRNKRVFMMTDESNIASQSGILKAGFRFYGSGYRSKILGIYKIENFADSH